VSARLRPISALRGSASAAASVIRRAVLLWVCMAAWMICANDGYAGRLASAATDELTLELPGGTLYAGVPFVVRVVVTDDDAVEAAMFPAVDGLIATGPPSTRQSRSTTVINGRVSQQVSMTFTFELVADAPGFVTIPSLLFETSRGLRRTAPRSVLISELHSSGLIEVRIHSERERYYVGESVELRLEIAIRRFEDERFGYVATAENSFQWIDERASRLGAFAGADRRTVPRTTWREERRTTAQGDAEVWHLFTRVVVERPTAPGPLVIDPVSILVRYPVRMNRRSDMLGRGTLQIVEEQLALGRAELPAITMLVPPEEGRPPTFRGAVGSFSVSADAQPRSVSVGDPVTFRVRVEDLTASGVRLDLLAPPALEEVPALTDRFRMPSDPLTGIIEDRAKVFTQSIRPMDDSVGEIPSIPFTYFDPRSEVYVTVETAPIAIDVAPVDRLTLDDFAQTGSVSRRSAERVTPGLRHPSPEAGDLLEERPAWTGIFRDRTSALLVLTGTALLPPLLAGAVLLVRVRRSRAPARRLAARREAFETARRICAGAKHANDRARDAADAVIECIGALAGRAPGATTGEEALRLLAAHVPSEEACAAAARIIRQAEQWRYGASSGPDRAAGGNAMTEECLALLQRVEEEWPA